MLLTNAKTVLLTSKTANVENGWEFTITWSFLQLVFSINTMVNLPIVV